MLSLFPFINAQDFQVLGADDVYSRVLRSQL